MSKTMAFLVMFVLQVCWQLCSAASSVKVLPGFQGPLPFQLQTGYIGVGDSEDVQLFYYFIKSESNPKSDPLIIWLSGGPGCSSFNGLIYEIGPITFAPVEYNGSLPTLLLNPFSWTKMANIIFLDLPVGTGFSYARTAAAHQSNTSQASQQAYEFVLKWLTDHEEFKSNPFYVGGDSFAGQLVPIITQVISNGKGYVLGNPVTFPAENNYRVPFAHGMGLIPDELYESLKVNCKGELYEDVNPENVKCFDDVQIYKELVSKIQIGQILEPTCNIEIQTSHKQVTQRRFLNEKLTNFFDPFSKKCREFWYALALYWANDEGVRRALGIEKGCIGEWQRCNGDLDYIYEFEDVSPYHANLSAKGYRSIIYSGDHDMKTTFISTQAWMRSLNYPIIDDWRPWMVEGQVAGYTRTYSNKMTFATVKGAGHTAPEFKPLECQTMMKKWFSNKPI